jgi:molybdopterin molybdotransferase
MASPLQPVDEVIKYLLAKVTPLVETRTVELDDALGYYLAADISSSIDVPPAANSAMDGYAVIRAEITEGGLYDVSARIPAGSVGDKIVSGSIVRIFTGAQIPPGADAVVIQEDTEIVEGQVRINAVPVIGENVRPQGQDIASGSVILEKGRRLHPQDLGLAASVGRSQVEIFRPLRVSILSTGDELVDPPGPTVPGQIYNSNRFALAGMLKDLGMEVVDLGIVADTPEATEVALRAGAEQSDCIVSTGGVSVGEEDYVKDIVEKLGELDLWRIAIKPGKPLAFGDVLGTPFFGLPGNPVSTFITFAIVARPYLVAYQGGSQIRAHFYSGEADFEHRAGNRREYLRVQTYLDNGVLRLRKFAAQGSGVMSSVSWANALAEVEVGMSVAPGDQLKYLTL